MPVPLLDLKAQNLALEAELKSAFERVLRSGHFILGREVTAFEHAMEEFTGAKHAIGVSSGTDAILLALMAADIGPGDEVLCPTFTFFATAGCIARVGATPVFVDSDPVTFNLDPADAERRMTARTKAIIPVHLFGQAAAMDEVMNLAAKRPLVVIEDAAQSLGATYKGKQLGAIGHIGIYSFFPSKNLGGFGDSGLLVTNDDVLAERCRLLRTHGAKPKYHHKLIGANFRIDALQAALLAVKLPHYSTYTQRRRENAKYYTAQLSLIPGVLLSDELGAADPPLVLPVAREGNYHIWNQYVLRVPGTGRRDALRALFEERKVGTEIYYPVPMHVQECFSSLAYQPNDLPVSMTLANEALGIPIFPELTRAQLDEVIGVITELCADSTAENEQTLQQVSGNR
jgi:dTDP-4-amino-4,6-dideoxygalactose transaminase